MLIRGHILPIQRPTGPHSEALLVKCDNQNLNIKSAPH